MIINKLLSLSPHQRYTLLAMAVALIALLIYLLTGQADLDQNLQKLQVPKSEVKDVQVENTETGGKNIIISCDDGSSYEVYIPAGEGDTAALKNNYCKK